jgi:hypothetical protein
MIRTRSAIAALSALAIAIPTGTGLAQGRGQLKRLSGTYQLDPERSESPTRVAERATENMRGDRRMAVYRNVMARAQAPTTLAIDVSGRNVTLMSSTGPRMTFVADGVARTEPGPLGQAVTTVAGIRDGRLHVSMRGAKGNDYAMTLEPTAEGLRLTRQLDNSYDGSVVSVRSEYHRIDNPRWNIARRYRPDPNAVGAAMLPSGLVRTTTLDAAFNTNTIRDGTRISLTVTGPEQYSGAVIEGVVGRITGQDKDNIAVTFDSLRLRDGRVGTFDGVIESVRMPDGTLLGVDTSGVVRGDDAGSTDELEKGAIGAALGAVLGAIISGKEGAIVGGVLGGAGAIVLDKSRQNRTLPAGTRFTVSTDRTEYVRGGPGRY